jgi:hypothetical protein
MALANLSRLRSFARNCKSIAGGNHRQMSYIHLWGVGYNSSITSRYGTSGLAKGDAWTTKRNGGKA